MKQKGVLIKQWLSRRYVGVGITLLAIAIRSLQLIFFFNIRVDASFQTLATDYFLHGHGISKAEVNPADLSEVIYTPLINWPPGFSLLLAPFYALFGHDYIAAGLTLDILFGIAVILALRRLLSVLDVPLFAINLFTLAHALFIYPYYFIASSDDIASAFLLFALLLFMKLVKANERTTATVFWFSLCLFFGAFIKYLFMPAAFALPLLLVYHSYRVRSPIIRRSAYLSLTILLVLTGAFLAYQKAVSGAATYVPSSGTGFYPEHIAETYPFLIASFINPETLSPGLAVLFKQNQLSITVFIINAILIALVGFLSLRKFFRKNATRLSQTGLFILASVTLIVFIYVVLLFMSVTQAKGEELPGQFWTYVQEPRYYGLILLLSQLIVVVLLKRGFTQQGKLARSVLGLCCFLWMIELGRGGVFAFNRVRLWSSETYSWQQEDRFQRYADTIIAEVRQQHPAAPVVVTGNSYYYNNHVALYSHVPVLRQWPQSDHPAYKTTKPVVMVTILLTEEGKKSYLDSAQSAAGQFGNFVFFTNYVSPDQD